MMWLAIDSIGTIPRKPKIEPYNVRYYIPPTEKIIKVGESEFKGVLRDKDILILADESKFNYAAEWEKMIREARDVSCEELRKTRQAGYAQGIELETGAQSPSSTK